MCGWGVTQPLFPLLGGTSTSPEERSISAAEGSTLNERGAVISPPSQRIQDLLGCAPQGDALSR